MESSSEDSFTWVTASSDSESDSMDDTSIETEPNRKQKKLKLKSGENYNKLDNEKDTKPNIKIKKEKLSDESCKKEKKKLIKTEPDSESDVQKKKRKLKHSQDEKDNNESMESDSYDERYLDSKVKQEKVSSSSGNINKRSLNCRESSVNSDSYDESYLDLKVKNEINSSLPVRKSKKTSLDINGSNASGTIDKTFHNSELSNENLNQDYESGSAKSKKKKKKHRKTKEDKIVSENDMDIEEQVSHSDIIISDAKLKSKRSVTLENDSFPDETSSGEISAILADEDHKLASILLDDSKARSNKKKNINLHKSTVLKQFKEDIEQPKSINEDQEQRKSTRISDRIMFEDDDEGSDFNTNIENETSSKLKKYLKANSNLKVVSPESTQNPIFTSDDELWIIKCPKNIDAMSLSGTKLNINDKCKIKITGQTYDGCIDEEHTGMVTVLSATKNKYELMNLPLRGTINFRRRIPKPRFYEDNIIINKQTNFTPLPDIKDRHPLFGYDYKKKIKVPSIIQAKLHPVNGEESVQTVEKRKKKKHKKDKNTVEKEDTGVLDEVIFPKTEPDSLHTGEKKRKKRKHLDDDCPAPKRVKKIKYDPECAEAWESEKAIAKTLFDF